MSKLLGSLFALFSAVTAHAVGEIPCDPWSEMISSVDGGPSREFCAQWNPEFAYSGNQCCAKKAKGSRRKGHQCSPTRFSRTYCDEMTDVQRVYIEGAALGKFDVLESIRKEMGRRGQQAYCTPNDGFLAWGRPIVASPANSLVLRSPHRCVNFGTDSMAGLLEWLGRQIRAVFGGMEQSGAFLLVGDISAPRGGCLAGAKGRRGHSSHTNGLDVDLGFLTSKTSSPGGGFHQSFDPKLNWWLLKEIFRNPFGCVKAVFLDRKWIGVLRKFAAKDPEWQGYERFLRHMPGHRNHFHVRIGDGPGQLGCIADPKPELEILDEAPLDGQGELPFES